MVAYLERLTNSAPVATPPPKGPPPPEPEAGAEQRGEAKEYSEYFEAILAGTNPGDIAVATELEAIQ